MPPGFKCLTAAVTGALVLATASQPAQASADEALDRFAIAELMDLYGVVHDFGTPEQYADLFTADGEIAVSRGGRAVIKGRDALMAQARRDHEKYVRPTGPNGENEFFMRHIVSNKVVTITGDDTAEGSCFVITLLNNGANGPDMLSFGRYFDTYAKNDGKWLITRREIVLDFGNENLAIRFGFRS